MAASLIFSAEGEADPGRDQGGSGQPPERPNADPGRDQGGSGQPPERPNREEVTKGGGSGPLDQLVSDLGSDDWNRRESAQEKILKQGADIAPRLEEASRSDNLELAFRAKYLLSRIDPRVTEFQVIKVELGARPRIAEVASGVGSEGKELILRSSAAQTDGSSFAITFRSLSPRQVEVQVAEWIPAASRVDLRPPLSFPGAVSILKRSEECLYRRAGLRIERERFRHVTLLRLREGRRSVLEKTPFPSESAAVLQSLLTQLFEQARWKEPEARNVALELLGDLGAPGATELFRSALGNARTRGAASLGLGERDLLLEVLKEASSRESNVQQEPSSDAEGIQAAVLLLKLGEEEGLEFLLRKLVEANPSELHPVVAALADCALLTALDSSTRSHFLQVVLSEDVMAHAAWEDVETEYFFSVVVERLEPKEEPDRALALAALERLQRLARGDLGPTNARLRSTLDLWLRVERKLSEEERPERRFLLGVLPALTSPSLLSEAMALLEECLQGLENPLSNEELTALIEALLQKIEDGDANLRPASLQGLVRFSRVLSPGPGQLRLVVEGLVKALELTGDAASTDPAFRSSQVYLKQAEEELIRWTGLRQPFSKIKPPGASAIRPEPGPSEPLLAAQRLDLAPFKEWTEDAARVQAREKEIAESHGARLTAPSAVPQSGAGLPDGTRLVFYEFDLLIDETKSEGDGLEVLDGRRLEVEPSRPLSYSDRWDNRLQLRLEPDPVPGEGKLKRWRLNGKTFVFTGIPALVTTQGKDLSSTWHETSDLFLGSRPILRRSTKNYRSLLLLLNGEDTPPSGIAEPKALWGWFLEHRLLDYAGDAGSQEGRAVLGVLRTLKVKECVQLLRRLFAASPTPDLARQLYEVGDESGLDYLRKELKNTNPQAKLRAAFLLSEMGCADGLETLAAIAESNPAALRASAYQVLNAVDACLRNPKTPLQARERAMDFLFARIGDALFQSRAFLILKRETGEDFGFSSGQGPAREAAVERARGWWASHKKR